MAIIVLCFIVLVYTLFFTMQSELGSKSIYLKLYLQMCVRLFLSREHNTLEGSIQMADSRMWNVCNFKQDMPAKWAKQLVFNRNQSWSPDTVAY